MQGEEEYGDDVHVLAATSSAAAIVDPLDVQLIVEGHDSRQEGRGSS